ncbi:hypothetical protein X777_15109 [Ooceraea biroi]|uniref:Uncharacterized protein n=1 Tax=Ooceraea biroi TaxID=2015173 RepID=A0A026WW03_OOCBI|nr:hypothetical protein X777_15109 [Ooceraea biroi]
MAGTKRKRYVVHAGGQRQRPRGSDVGGGGGSSEGRDREKKRDIADDGTAEEDEEGWPEEGDRAKSSSSRSAAGWKGDTKMEKRRKKENSRVSHRCELHHWNISNIRATSQIGKADHSRFTETSVDPG